MNDWQKRREQLLHEACLYASMEIDAGSQIGKALQRARRKFRKRSCGEGRGLRLSSASMRRFWDAWKKKRAPKVFRLRFKPAQQRIGIPEAFMDRAIETALHGDCTIKAVSLALQDMIPGVVFHPSTVSRRIDRDRRRGIRRMRKLKYAEKRIQQSIRGCLARINRPGGRG